MLVSACGPDAPVDSFGSDLDANCRPHDPIDKLGAAINPKKFWLAREFEMRAFIKAGESNIANSKVLLTENRTRKNEYRTIATAEAKKAGYSGADLKNFIAKYMKEHEQMAISSKRAIESEKRELAWAMRCLKVVQGEVRKLKVTREEREAAKPASMRKMKLTIDDLREFGSLTIDQAKMLAKETTLSRSDMAKFLSQQRNPRVPQDVRDEILEAFDKGRR
ncbi:protein of unknown function [Magnetospira sp. QH-2]|nr:protein of unknown function [Magnetospira sp. QH-2]